MPERLLRQTLNYALHADENLDVKQIAISLESNPELKQTAMSLAEKLIAQGEAKGEARGKWIGRIHVLEELMGLPVTDGSILAKKTATGLETKFRALKQKYAAQFKNRA